MIPVCHFRQKLSARQVFEIQNGNLVRKNETVVVAASCFLVSHQESDNDEIFEYLLILFRSIEIQDCEIRHGKSNIL